MTSRALLVAVITLGCLCPPPVTADQLRPAGVLTEVRVGRSATIVVLRAGSAAPDPSEREPARPLQTLNAGDRVVVSGDASAVAVLLGRRDPVRIGPANSPYRVSEPPTAPLGNRVLTVLGDALRVFVRPEPSRERRVVRHPPPPPDHREDRLRRTSVVFPFYEELQSFRILGPAGVVWEGSGVGRQLTYPSNAPPLAPRESYRLEATFRSGRTFTVVFSILSDEQAAEIDDRLQQLTPQALPGLPPQTRELLRIGVLLGAGLRHEADQLVSPMCARTPVRLSDPSLDSLCYELQARVRS